MVGGPRRLPMPGAQDEYEGVERDSWLGMYRALFSQNVPVDYVHADDVAENGIAGYKLLYVPYPIMMGEETARAITRFVEQGGCAVLEARAAWNDRRGFSTPTIPGFGLDQVFGAREAVVTPASQPQLVIKVKDPSTPLLPLGARLPGLVYQQGLETLGRARSIAEFEDGTSAMIASSHGRGKTLFVGSYLSMAYERTRNPQLEGFFRGLLEWAGVEHPVKSSPGAEVRWLEGPGYTLYFVLNDAAEELAAQLWLKSPHAAPAVHDLVTGQDVPYQNEEGRLRLQKTLPPQGAWILHVEAARK